MKMLDKVMTFMDLNNVLFFHMLIGEIFCNYSLLIQRLKTYPKTAYLNKLFMIALLR